MRKLLRPRLLAGVAGGLVAVALIAAAAVQTGLIHAASTPFVSHPVNVHPELTQLGDPTVKNADASYGLFTCQVGEDPGVQCYDPYQMRTAYNMNSLINSGDDGTGRTIVIVDAFDDPYLTGDVANFDAFYGLPAINLQIVRLTSTPTFDVGWAEETTLDVEWSHAIAPGANIVLEEATTNQDADILAALQDAVNNNRGDVISQSFGENESCVDPAIVKAQHEIYAKATLKHITLFASSADDGAAQQTCDGNSWVQAASFPADDPLVTAVGGTELHAADYCLSVLGCDPTANPAAGTYQSEVAWNEPNIQAASGGGYSKLYSRPFYQLGSVHNKGRGVPDVAYNAAVFHGVLVQLFGGWYLFGGTSAGSPQWAAITAIADQKAGRRLGFINGALYLVGAIHPLYSQDFHDILSGNNSVVETDASNNPVSVSGFNTSTGWDAVTGLGSPNVANLLALIQQYDGPTNDSHAVQQTGD